MRKSGVSLATLTPIKRAFRELKEYGYQFVDRDYDIALVNLCYFPKGHMLEAFLRKHNTHLVIFDERVSAGRLPFWHLGQKQVLGYVKTSLLKDKTLYRFKYPDASYHYHLMDKIYNGKKSCGSRQHLDETLFHKVHLGWNLGLYDFFTGVKPDFEKDRPVDIHFSVVTKPFFDRDDQYYILHRNNFVKEVDRIVNKYKLTTSGLCGKRRMFPTLKLEIDREYHSLMSKSKVCLSPFGDGEMCWRDFEAVVHGAILIKPDVSFIDTWPNIYRPMETYIPIKLDLSDLEEVIYTVTNNYSKYKYIIINAYESLKKSFSNEVFASRFNRIMKSILEKESLVMGDVIDMEQKEDGSVEMKKDEKVDPGFTFRDKRKIGSQPVPHPPPPLQPPIVEQKRLGQGKKEKICIVTNFMEFNPRYSLTGIVKDHIEVLTKNGHKVGLVVNTRYRDKDFEGVEMLKVLPFAHLKDYQNVSQLKEEHKQTIEDTSQALQKVFTDKDGDGEVYELAFCHDINFQGWFLPYKLGLEKAAPLLPHVRWFHWVHSIPSGMREYWSIPSKKHKIIFPNETDRLRVAEQFKGELDDVRVVHHIKDMRTFMDFDPVTCRMIDQYDLMSATILQVYPASVDRLSAKGVDHVLKIFSNLKKQGEIVRLVILNQWCNVDRHRQTVDQYCQVAKNLELEPDKEVIFSSRFEVPRFETGVDAKIVKDLFSLSNLFIFPTREEAFGLVLPEAALSGGVLLVLNRSLQMQSEVAGLNALYFDFGSFTHNFNIPGDKYYEDIATIVRGRMRQEYSLMGKTFMRRTYNMDRIYKEEILPIIGESRNW